MGNAEQPVSSKLRSSRAGSRIRKIPGVCGGEACVGDTRITVWGLVEWRNQGLSDSEILERTPGLHQFDLDAAWEYYSNNADEIDQAIRENESA